MRNVRRGWAAVVGLWFHPLRTRHSPLPRAHYRKGGAQKKERQICESGTDPPPNGLVTRGECQTGRQDGGREENEHNVFTLGAARALMMPCLLSPHQVPKVSERDGSGQRATAVVAMKKFWHRWATLPPRVNREMRMTPPDRSPIVFLAPLAPPSSTAR